VAACSQHDQLVAHGVRTRGQVRESFESHLDAINWACHLAKAEGEELVVHAVDWSDCDTPADQAA
jgi:hypothetical protein